MDHALLTPHQLSAHLRALRKSRGLSQAALGALLGVGQARVARIEGNPTAVSVAQLIELLGALGVQLVLRDGPAPQPGAEAAPRRRSPRRPPVGGDW